MGSGDITHRLTVPVKSFITGFGYRLPYFGSGLYVRFLTPYQDGLVYVLEGMGLPYAENSTGNLYLELQIDPAPETTPHPRLCDLASVTEASLDPTPLTFVSLTPRYRK